MQTMRIVIIFIILIGSNYAINAYSNDKPSILDCTKIVWEECGTPGYIPFKCTTQTNNETCVKEYEKEKKICENRVTESQKYKKCITSTINSYTPPILNCTSDWSNCSMRNKRIITYVSIFIISITLIIIYVFAKFSKWSIGFLNPSIRKKRFENADKASEDFRNKFRNFGNKNGKKSKVEERLEEIKKLFEKGIITKEEYENQRKKILNEL